MSKERLAICEQCLYHSKFHHTPLRPDAHCTLCECTLSAKTKCLSCECPMKKPKWTAIISEEEEAKMEEENGKPPD